MTDDQQRPRSSLAIWLIAGALQLPVGYVLSTGPFVWLFKQGAISQPIAELIAIPYEPLGWLSEYWEPFGKLLEWYMDLWR
jgi:hypothetical protein